MPTVKTVGRLTGRDGIRLSYNFNSSSYGSGGTERFGITRNSVSQVTYGDNRPDWKNRIAEGLCATTTLAGQTYRASSKGHFNAIVMIVKKNDPKVIGTYKVSGTPLAWVATPNGSLGSISLSRADNLAKAQISKKILDAQRMFQSGVFLGELRESIALIRRPASALRKRTDGLITRWSKNARKARLGPRVRNLPRNHPKVRSELRKAGAETWLEWSFGVTPLFNDVKDAAEAAAESLVRARPPRKVIRGVGIDRVSKTSQKVSYKYDAIWYRWITTELTTEVSVKYTASVTTGAAKPTLSRNLSLFGVSPREILPTVWELIPYSFLVDYFTNIGDIIEALSLDRSSVLWVERSTCVSRRNALHDTEIVPGEAGVDFTMKQCTISPVDSDVWVDTRLFSRSEYTGSLVPSLVFEIPGIGSRKWLNIGALIAARNRSADLIRD